MTLREEIQADEEQLTVAREKESKSTGSGDTPTMENIQQKTVAEFMALKMGDRKDHIRAVSEVIPENAGYDFATVNGKALRGYALSVEERAFLTNEITTRLLNKDGSYDAKCLTKLAGRYPEVYQLVTERFMATKEAEKWRRENCPVGWEKMLDLVKKYPALAAILMALIAGGVTASGGGLPALGFASMGAKKGIFG